MQERRMRAIQSVLVLLLLGAASCGEQQPTVVVYSSVDQVFAEPVLRKFEEQSGVDVRAVFDTEETKSTGVLNRIIAEAKQPQADVFWSGDPMRPFQLIRRGLVEPYSSAGQDDVPEHARDPESRWTAVSARARVLLINTQLVTSDAP